MRFAKFTLRYFLFKTWLITIRKEGLKMEVTLTMYIIICPLIFLAGFIDSIAGGGGLISLPAYAATGMPMHLALGTNKFTSSCGTVFSTFRFIKSGKIHYKSAITSAAGALLGSYLGARAALALSDTYLKYCLIVFLPIIAIFILSRRGFGEKDRTKNVSIKKIIIFSLLSGVVIGAYDGFFGPGTGTFLILIYTGLLGFNLTVASGNAKIVNLSSNIAALFTFLISGNVLYTIGLPAAAFGILGHWIGSGLAIKNGSKIIKPMLLFVLIMLLAKIGYDLIIG